jgi:hypothetical protein
LDLNIERVEQRQANHVRIGFEFAGTQGDLGFSWADAVARDLSEANHLIYEENKRRASVRQQARIKAMWERQQQQP